MLYDTSRHEALQPLAWDEALVRAAITEIVAQTDAQFSPDIFWPWHPSDQDDASSEPGTTLYYGATGVCWALDYLRVQGAATPQRDYGEYLPALQALNLEQIAQSGEDYQASYLMGQTPLWMLAYGRDPSTQVADQLAALIEQNQHHPARELMWGAPGTLLAALFLYRRSGDARWAELFRSGTRILREQLRWSERYQCHYWTQDLYDSNYTYLDGVHGFVATAAVLIQGRDLLVPSEWTAWQQCIVQTMTATVTRSGTQVNWRAMLEMPSTWSGRYLTQFCHGAPGFVICLADLPEPALDDLLLGAGETVWAAGPLKKGSNLCHGTGGNGYTFLKLYNRTNDAIWLDRARAFAMHGIAQTRAHRIQYGQSRHSLWTGDIGFAIYLWDCLRGRAAFPTLDVFYSDTN